jgi:hypothetical protein
MFGEKFSSMVSIKPGKHPEYLPDSLPREWDESKIRIPFSFF